MNKCRIVLEKGFVCAEYDQSFIYTQYLEIMLSKLAIVRLLKMKDLS